MKRVIMTLVVLSAVQTCMHGRVEDEEAITRIAKGNLAVSSSQQTGPLFGFGQNVIDQGDFLGYVNTNYLNGCNKDFTRVTPAVLWGIRNTCSLFVALPIAAQLKLDCDSSHGLGDLLVQFEYSPYGLDRPTYGYQWTVVGNVTFPTGSSEKEPNTGAGSPTFFLGTTFSYMDIDWYAYAALGGIMATTHKSAKPGNQVLYQAGVGRNIASKANSWIFNVTLEFIGIYQQRNKEECGVLDCNSGANFFSIAPSLWFSTNRLILQAGIGVPLVQQLNGDQNKNNFSIAVNIGWKFAGM